MAGINKVILVGHLGKDPEVMTFDNGVKKASFSMATTESYKDKEGNWQDKTEWHNIVLWRYLAEKNIIKGDQIYLEGRLRTRSYEDSNGVKKYVTEIQGDKVLKLSSPGANKEAYKGNEQAQASEPSPSPDLPSDVEDNDDLPF
ncbi:MAG: single-stranded DNA-binding protein [Bacteroidales bacterium]|jgi:single-strand DNA-binding protein|nr:single-stranded DNA-binding protein [Bacteroidales bacterium]